VNPAVYEYVSGTTPAVTQNCQLSFVLQGEETASRAFYFRNWTTDSTNNVGGNDFPFDGEPGGNIYGLFTKALTTANVRKQITLNGGDGITELQPTIIGYFPVQYAGTITDWSVAGDASGSATVDVWKKNGAIPTIADSICGGGIKPYLSSEQIRSGTDFTGWSTTAVVPGDVIAFSVTGTATIKRLACTLHVL